MAAASLPVCSSKELFGDSDDDDDMLLELDAPCTPSPRVSLPCSAANTSLLVSSATVSQGPAANRGPHSLYFDTAGLGLGLGLGFRSSDGPITDTSVSEGPGAYRGPHSLSFDTAATVSPTTICSTDGPSDESSGGITDSELSVFLEELFPSNSGDEDSVGTIPTLHTGGACWHQGVAYIFDDKPPIFTFSYHGGIYRGRINSDGLPHGVGYLIFNKDVYFYGYWSEGVENGFGILFFSDKTYTIDVFESGRKCSSSGLLSLADSSDSIKRINTWPSQWFEFH